MKTRRKPSVLERCFTALIRSLALVKRSTCPIFEEHMSGVGFAEVSIISPGA